MTDELALAAVILEAQRRTDEGDYSEAIERLRRLTMADDIDALDVRDTYADTNRVRRAVGIAIAALRLEPMPGELLDARREDVVRLATEQLRRDVMQLLDRVAEL